MDFDLFLNACFFDRPKILAAARERASTISEFMEIIDAFCTECCPRSSKTIQDRARRFDRGKLDAMLEQYEIQVLSIDSDDYPVSLAEIPYPPPVLFYKGNPKLLSGQNLAVVGTRNPSKYGQQVTQSLILEIASSVNIVSGLALGIDAIAHHHCLKAKGNPIAVIANGLDDIQPARNRILGQSVIQEGVLVSEFPPGVGAAAHHFPQRNRIISGLSTAVLVIEAAAKSGALITARLAMEQNREVLAVPGSVFSEVSVGTNQLIQDGAKMVTQLSDILEEFLPGYQRPATPQIPEQNPAPRRELPTLTEQEKTVLDAIKGSMHLEEISDITGMAIPILCSPVTSLVLKDVIKEVQPNTYAIDA